MLLFILSCHLLWCSIRKTRAPVRTFSIINGRLCYWLFIGDTIRRLIVKTGQVIQFSLKSRAGK